MLFVYTPTALASATSLPCASEVSHTTQVSVFACGRRAEGNKQEVFKSFFISFIVNLVGKVFQWWPTGRKTAGRRRHINKRTGAEDEAEAPIIQIITLDLSDILRIRMCSSHLLGMISWIAIDSGRKGKLLEKTDFASSKA